MRLRWGGGNGVGVGKGFLYLDLSGSCSLWLAVVGRFASVGIRAGRQRLGEGGLGVLRFWGIVWGINPLCGLSVYCQPL